VRLFCLPRRVSADNAGSPDRNSCDSTHLTSFSGEVALHSPGLKNLDKPTCFVFPQVVVCQDCGFSVFNLTPHELQRLSDCTESGGPSEGGVRLRPEFGHRRVGIALLGAVELRDFREMNFGYANFLSEPACDYCWRC
jgi:hypothetical protein